MTATPRATVLTVIVNYATPRLAIAAAEAARDAMAHVDGAITIVDNASPDGSAEALRHQIERRGWGRGPVPVRLIAARRNGGFATGNNIAIRAGLPGGAHPDYVWCLNPDAIPARGALDALVRYIRETPGCGLAGSLLINTDGTRAQTAFRFPHPLGEFDTAARFGPVSRLLHRWVTAPALPAASGPVDWTAGASLLIARDVLDATGGYDPGFFLYFEEVDLCRRARAAGYATGFVLESVVGHIGGAATGMDGWTRAPAYWFDSRARYYLKAGGRGMLLAAWAGAVAGNLIGGAWRLVRLRRRAGPRLWLRDLTASTLRALHRMPDATHTRTTRTAPRPVLTHEGSH